MTIGSALREAQETGGIMVEVEKLRVVERPSGNNKFPVAYRVENEQGPARYSFEGLFGWGWCSSRERALLNAGVSEEQVDK